jgi:hypothetical protein
LRTDGKRVRPALFVLPGGRLRCDKSIVMKYPWPVFATALLLAFSAHAQVTLELQLDQKQYIPGEALVVRARIGNFSGQPLGFGRTADWLTFEVQSSSGQPVQRLAAAAVLGEFQLDTASIATKKVNLAPAFDLSRPGRYRVVATVHMPEWDKRWTSKEVGFDIIKGTKIWERDFGVPNPAGGPPEMRKFALLEARYLDKPTLYVRLGDVTEREVLAVRPIGTLLSFSKPDGQMDQQNRLHVLWQDAARSFTYVTLAYGGEVTLRQTFQMTNTRPALRPGPEGTIQVVGGARVETTQDIPPPATASANPPPVLP